MSRKTFFNSIVMTDCRFRLWLPVLLAALLVAESPAETIVFVNRTARSVLFGIGKPGQAGQADKSNKAGQADKSNKAGQPGQTEQGYRIASGDLLPIPVVEPQTVRFISGDQPQLYQVRPNEIYDFIEPTSKEGSSGTVTQTAGVRLIHRPLSPDADGPIPVVDSEGSVLSPSRESLERIGVLPVMILVDDDEPARREIWERRLRERVAEASTIFEHHARVRLEVVGVGTWDSDDQVHAFGKSLREFEREVPCRAPAAVMIGFTSQYRFPKKGDAHLGGTRGPFTSHILIREWSNHISKAERLEVLVHELGHLFGAAHSAEGGSVMRPSIGDRRSNSRAFRIGFDPLNTMILSLFCQELVARGAKSFRHFTPECRQRLGLLYAELGRRSPGDDSSQILAARVRRGSGSKLSKREEQRLIATRLVLRSIQAAARSDQRREADRRRDFFPKRIETAARASDEETDFKPADSTDDCRVTDGDRLADGDRLTGLYGRAAATAVEGLPRTVGVPAFLLGLGIALDDSDSLEKHPVLKELLDRLKREPGADSASDRSAGPTIFHRGESACDFGLAVAWTVAGGAGNQSPAVLLATLDRVRQQTNGRALDPVAALSGAFFARYLLKSPDAIATVAHRFSPAAVVPRQSDFQAALKAARVDSSDSSELFLRVLLTLPFYEATQKR